MAISYRSILKHLELINRFIKNLKDLQAKTDIKTFFDLPENKNLLQYSLFQSILNSIDIANIIISELNVQSGDNIQDVFKVLYESSIITEETMNRMSELSKLRTDMVPVYNKSKLVDFTAIYSKLPDYIAVLEIFGKEIIAFIETKS